MSGNAGGGRNVTARRRCFLFTQNQKEEYALTLADGVDVRLFAPHNQVVFSQTKEKQIIAEISCNGEILYEKPGWRQKLQSEYGQNLKSGDIKRCWKRNLKIIFSKLHRKWKSTARTAIKKLGGQRRDWYLLYQKQPEQYEKDMEIIYRVKVDWVNMGE